jgi:hypothetical protein
MGAGEWASDCTYNLQLKGVDENLDDNNENPDPTPPPPDKPMTLTILRDSQNLYLGFRWSHDPQSGTPTEFLLGMGFDFNANGRWEDTDNNLLGPDSVHTVDDAMLLVYLGVNIGEPNPPENAWVKIYIPDGTYVLSWGDKNDDDIFSFDAIAGPPAEPGTIYGGVVGPVLDGSGNTVDLCPLDAGGHATCAGGQDYGAGYSPLFVGYEYVLEFKVARAFFHSPAGFGFALTQNGDGWTWPTVLDASKIDLNIETSAEALGLLGDVASGWGMGLLDPSPSSEPVGGVTTTVDRVALVMPWIAAFAILGIAVLAMAADKRRT